MRALESIIESAKKKRTRIVLPESGDKRIIEAAGIIKRERIADIRLIASSLDRDLERDFPGSVIVPSKYPELHLLIDTFLKMKKNESMTEAQAREILLNNDLYFSSTMVAAGLADSVVVGATYPTREVIRANMKSFSIDRDIGIVFGLFIIEVDNTSFGEDGIFILADCAVIPQPKPRQLKKISIASADIFKKLFNIEPRVALLTYSSHGSAEGESIDCVREALSRIKEKRPDILVDGELQLDAAIVPEIQQRKAPNSPLGGRANILIFPSLDAGNITYKAIERFGGARAVGPILIGLNKITSDLSRGCSVRDIVATVALTSVLTIKE